MWGCRLVSREWGWLIIDRLSVSDSDVMESGKWLILHFTALLSVLKSFFTLLSVRFTAAPASWHSPVSCTRWMLTCLDGGSARGNCRPEASMDDLRRFVHCLVMVYRTEWFLIQFCFFKDKICISSQFEHKHISYMFLYNCKVSLFHSASRCVLLMVGVGVAENHRQDSLDRQDQAANFYSGLPRWGNGRFCW